MNGKTEDGVGRSLDPETKADSEASTGQNKGSDPTERGPSL